MSPAPHSRRDFLKGPAHFAPDPTAASSAEPTPIDNSYLIQVGRTAMACQFEVLLNADAQKEASEVAIKALDLVDKLEDKLSLYRDHSDLCRVNRLAAKEPQAVDDDLWEILEYATQLYSRTNGAFDITSAPLSRLWGFYRRDGRIPDPEEITQTLQQVGMRHLKLNAKQQTVFFDRPEIELDLGSLGKGFAIDQCRDLLKAAGVEDFLIHGGYSSVLAAGKRLSPEVPVHGWAIAVRDPYRPNHRLGRLVLKDQALGTSGLANQSFIYQGRRYGHILDPQTGMPADRLVSVTVVSPIGMCADALATAFFVMGPEAVHDYCQTQENIGALLLVQTSNLGTYEIDLVGIAAEQWLPDT